MLKTIARPFMSRRIFSGIKSDLTREAVPYFEGELLEMMLNEEDITLQFEKESSEILISCKCRISILFLRIKVSTDLV